jgi:hypothetical protein
MSADIIRLGAIIDAKIGAATLRFIPGDEQFLNELLEALRKLEPVAAKALLSEECIVERIAGLKRATTDQLEGRAKSPHLVRTRYILVQCVIDDRWFRFWLIVGERCAAP